MLPRLLRPQVLVPLLLGVALLGGSVAAFLTAGAWSLPLGTALLVLAGFVLALLPGRYVALPLLEGALGGSARALSVQAAAFGLQGRAVYVPAVGNLDEERVFLPAADSAKPMPTLDAQTLLYEAPTDRKMGIAFAPPGLALLNGHEAELGRSLKGAALPEAQTLLAALGRNTGLFRGLTVTQDDSAALQVSYTATARIPCLEPSERAPHPCEQGACVVCSAILAGLSRSLERELHVQAIRVVGREVRFDVRSEAPA